MKKILLALLLVLALGAGAFWLRRARSSDASTFYGHKFNDPREAYDFTLTDQNGMPFSLSSLRGKLVLMAFGFTSCPNICPTTLGDLAAAYRALPPADQARVQVVFISVDPERDTPKVLKDYVPFFDKHFIGLTGSAEQIAKVAKAYGAFYERSYQSSKIAANYYTINHSTYVYVIGPNGRWIGLYDYDQLHASSRLAIDVQRFLNATKS